MRGAPHNGFSRHMRLMRSRTSRETGGRPLRRGRDFQVQKRRKPLRCRPITVAGLTIARAPRQSGQKPEIRTQNRRSDGCSRGQDVFRFSTASCWRTAKHSKYEAANTRSSRCRRATRIRMSIFRMAEKLSGRWPDSQGFCGVRNFDEPQRFCAHSVAVVIASAAGVGVDAVGRNTSRRPVFPVPLAALATRAPESLPAADLGTDGGRP